MPYVFIGRSQAAAATTNIMKHVHQITTTIQEISKNHNGLNNEIVESKEEKVTTATSNRNQQEMRISSNERLIWTRWHTCCSYFILFYSILVSVCISNMSNKHRFREIYICNTNKIHKNKNEEE